jgi:hypothetical protein
LNLVTSWLLKAVIPGAGRNGDVLFLKNNFFEPGVVLQGQSMQRGMN